MNTTEIAEQIKKTRMIARPTVSLMDELMAIDNGSCIWCERKLPHPSRSRCSRKDALISPIAMTGMNVA